MEISINVRKIFKNDFVNKLKDAFIGRGAFVLFTMLFSLVSTRLYGAEVFGEYMFAFTVAQVLMIFSKVGLDSGLMYYIPKVGNRYTSSSFLINLVFSVIIILVIGYFYKDPFIRIMLPLIWILSIEQIFFGIYRVKGKIKEFYLMNGIVSILIRIGFTVVLFIIWGQQTINLAIATYISVILAAVYYIYENKNDFKKLIFNIDIIKYSLPLVLASAMVVVIDKLDIIMIGIMLTNKDVGIYQISAQISSAMAMILIIFNTVFAPKIAELHHEGKVDDLKSLYIKSTRILALLSIISLLLMIIFSRFLLQLFGTEFLDAQTSLILRSIGQFINVAVGSVWLMLSMTGQPRYVLYGNVVACLLNIILNYLLIPKFGIDGAAFASLVAVGLSNIMGYYFVCKHIKAKAFGLF